MLRPSSIASKLTPWAVGAFLFLHALAHSLPGTAATNDAAHWLFITGGPLDLISLWVAALLWSVASGTLAAAGLSVLGVPMLAGRWRRLAGAGAIASLLLFLLYDPRGASVGPVLDLGILVGLWATRPTVPRAASYPRPAEVAR